VEIDLKKEASIIINLLNSQRFEEAINKITPLIKKFPDQLFFYNTLSIGYNGIKDYQKSLDILNKGLQKDSKEITLLNNLGLTYQKIGNEDQAEKKFSQAIQINPKFLDAYINLANIKKSQNKNDEAIKILVKCLNPNPNNFILNFILANNYQSTGKFTEAKKLYKKCLALSPQSSMVDKSLSMIVDYNDDEDHFKSMQKKLSGTNDKVSQMYLNFAVGKAFEDVKNYKDAFKSFQKGNELKNEMSAYSIDNETKTFNKIKSIFNDPKILDSKEGDRKIIFVVGMPRSGTSLVEQILSSHIKIYGAGELSFLSDIIEKEINSKEQKYSDLQSEYMDCIKKFKHEEEYLVDKTPLNFKWIGFILNFFPNSKIIHCKRSAVDVCWSNYKNLFSSEKLNYSYTFSNLANYYRLYEDLMLHWSKIYKNKFYEIDYEKLVKNKEEEIKNILKYLDLDWDENCLNFHKNKRSVSTASLAQVRKPIYNSSVEKWKNYNLELTSLVKMLNQNT
jgi:tetratricopeptide (TPR) repeat protein